jgi:predicted Fe-S protein YdhL (DUF1289 family)
MANNIPDSPCIGLCSTQFEDVCRGCGRTVMEVAEWIFMPEPERLKVWIRVTEEHTAIRFRDKHLYRQYPVDTFKMDL